MLSYQHAYHAGNLADVHKHALLAWCLSYLTQKPKPLTYIETHAGRGLYDLTSAEAEKTGEALKGIGMARDWFAPNHPYLDVLNHAQDIGGAHAYPGSPFIASHLLRADDTLHLAELHPQEIEVLRQAVPGAHVHQRDGLEMALAISPPTPRRGFCLIDPSYEVKTDYEHIPKTIRHLHRKWPVGCIMLWYPLLVSDAHSAMIAQLSREIPKSLIHDVTFPPARDGHRMIGSGLFVINPPFGFSDAAADLGARFADLT